MKLKEQLQKLSDEDLLMTIILADEEGKPIVLVRFANFDNDEQAQDFITVFKHKQNLEQLGYINETIH
tara:strand:- start:473 stop:676 length:204 start_codon:yes stop_codon:yes gene_type:complete